MAVLTGSLHLAGLISCLLLITSTVGQTVTTPAAEIVDVAASAKLLIQNARSLADQAKNGALLGDLKGHAQQLYDDGEQLLQNIPNTVSGCELNAVIKMAAARTGSHEVLSVMQANDELSILNGRLSLSLAFLENVAQQLEDELALTGDIASQVAALIFGANTTISVIDAADAAVKEAVAFQSQDAASHRVRRQSVNLGSGWTLGLDGVKWQSSNGMMTFSVKPKIKQNFKVQIQATLIIRF